jgi:hypothetical protein
VIFPTYLSPGRFCRSFTVEKRSLLKSVPVSRGELGDVLLLIAAAT